MACYPANTAQSVRIGDWAATRPKGCGCSFHRFNAAERPASPRVTRAQDRAGAVEGRQTADDGPGGGQGVTGAGNGSRHA